MIEKGVVPEIQVGVFSGKEILFTLNGVFAEKGSGKKVTGKWTALRIDNQIKLVNAEQEHVFEAPADFIPLNPARASLVLHGVTIGVDFHWERKEDQVFRGSLRLIAEGDKLTAVNIVSVEDYLISVISSEMKATSSEEFLKAHAVTSRSWLLAQISKSQSLKSPGKKYNSFTSTGEEIIKWYDREDH